MLYFVDANIFLRYLTNDHPQKAAACRTLFKKAESREIELTTSETIIAEVVYILESKKNNGYALPRQQIRDILYPLLSLKGLKLPNRTIYLRALDIYAQQNLDFEDTLLIAYTEQSNLHQLYSYDTGIDQINTIQRIEP